MKIPLFDLVGTVFNMSHAREGDLSFYGHQIADWRDPTKARQAIWTPLTLPKSWELLPAHVDAVQAIAHLRAFSSVRCVTLSNLPIRLQIEMSRNSCLWWDFMIPLEAIRVYKTHPSAYLSAIGIFGHRPASDFIMVTANRTYGDLEAAHKIGMQTVLIDRNHEHTVTPGDTFKTYDNLYNFAVDLTDYLVDNPGA